MATIRKRGRSYQIRVSDGYDVRGKQKIRTMTWTPDEKMSEKQIEKELNRQAVLFEEQIKSQGGVTGNIKFETFADLRWFPEYAEKNLKPRTYDEMLRKKKRVYPILGHIRMDRITRQRIMEFLASLDGLSSKTKINYLNFISDVLGYAVELGLINSNPALGIKIKRDDKKEKLIYSLDETRYFLDCLESEPIQFQVICLLVIWGGFRPEELLGFEWSDVDFENQLVSVNRVSQYSKSKGVFTDTPKTKRSVRVIKMPEIVFQKLQLLKRSQLEIRLKIGDQWINSDRLLIGWNGKPMHPNMPGKMFRQFCQRINLPCYGLYSFRHFHASILIANGIDIETVSAEMGHSNTTTTLNVYSHAIQEARAKTSAILADVLSVENKNLKTKDK